MLSAIAAKVNFRDGVDELAPVRYHVEVAGDLAVQHVRQAGHSDDGGGIRIVPVRLGAEIDHEINRDEYEPEVAHYIGN